MNPSLVLVSLASAATAAPAVDPGEQAIVVTASREPLAHEDAAVSASLLGEAELDRLALPHGADLLRLVPGVSVAVSGPPGSQAQLRIRGAEANHSLLFVDGIRFNDPAAGNEARFELLSADGLSRLEVVRGPQSALWGSEAIGGVIAAETTDPRSAPDLSALAEYGSLESGRAAAGFALREGALALGGRASWLGSEGIDAFGAGGDRDGFDQRSASLKAIYRASANAELGLVGHWIAATSQYDGFDPATFLHADTLDETDSRIAAGRAWGRLGFGSGAAWTLSFGASLLDSANRNRLGKEPLNRTGGRRLGLEAQLSRKLVLAGAEHRFTAALERQEEDFRARDRHYSGATDQDPSRAATALVGEWRTDWGVLASDIAVRHDRFSAFADATTLRGTLLLRLGGGWSAHVGYGEGIAQPTFYDLHGFFPGSFVGNPALAPERARSWEVGIGWSDARTAIAFTGYAARLRDEIVDIFDPETFLSSTANASGTSRRRGIELEATRRVGRTGSIALTYGYLDAGEQQVAGDGELREVRRPRHSASALAAVSLGAAEIGAGLAYVGTRIDTDFDSFPARRVRLGDYLLASLAVTVPIDRKIAVYARVENGFDADYREVFGYETPGRTVHAGLRLRFGD